MYILYVLYTSTTYTLDEVVDLYCGRLAKKRVAYSTSFTIPIKTFPPFVMVMTD